MSIINNLNNAMYSMHDNFQAKFNNMVHTGNNANASKQVQDTQAEEKQAAAPADAFVPSAEASADEFTANAVNSGAAAGMTKGLNETEENAEASETGETQPGAGKVGDGANEAGASEENPGAADEITDDNADSKIDQNRQRADQIKNGGAPGGPGGPDDPDDGKGGKKADGPSGPRITAEEAQKAAERQKEMDQVRNILVQMAADRRKWLAELIKTIRETNDKIFEIIQSSILNRASVFNSVNKAWSDVIRGR